jgi:hypothetical protein
VGGGRPRLQRAGPRARAYKARVTSRMAGAKAAQKAKKPFVPGDPDL